MESIWERPERPSGAAAPLSRAAIVRAAITLADADGLAAVSVRKVAAVLGAGHMRLYGYFATKDELIDLMIDSAYGEIPIAPGADWRATIEGITRGTRSVALRHPWFADLLGGRPTFGPHALAHHEATLSALATAIPDVDAIARAAGAVRAYLAGALRREIGQDEKRWQAESGPYLSRALATGKYPQVARFVHDATHTDPAAAFDAGLRLVLDGIAGQVRDQGTSTRSTATTA